VTSLKPKCHPFWIENGEKVINDNMTSLAFTSTGYVMPCCWMDPVLTSEKEDNPLFVEELKLEKHKSVKEVLLSKQWVQFHRDLIDKPEQAMKCCKITCGQ
jgi:hypothetical protein